LRRIGILADALYGMTKDGHATIQLHIYRWPTADGCFYLTRLLVSSRHNTLLSLCALLISCAVFLVLARVMGPFVPDDSFISFRYAENLAHGHGLTFNPGEAPVEGYSNFLWVVLCALLVKIGFADLPHFTPQLGALLGILSLLLLWVLLRRRGYSAALIFFPLLALASAGPVALYAISGMEAPLFAFLLLAAILCADGCLTSRGFGWSLALAVTGALLAMCRPEGIVAFPVIVVFLFYQRGRAQRGAQPALPGTGTLLIACLFFVVAFTAYTMWRVHWFGDLLPLPFHSKGAAGERFYYAWFRNIPLYFISQNESGMPFGYYYVMFFFLALAGVLYGRAKKQLSPTDSLALLLTFIYIIVYANFNDWMPAMRYHAVLIGLLIIPAARLLTPAFSSTPESPRLGALPYAALSIALLMGNLSAAGQLRLEARNNWQSTNASLISLGRWLHTNMPADALLAISDVGAAPYYSGLRTFDTNPQSLLDPHIVREGWSDDYFFQRQPAAVVFVSFSLTRPAFYEEHLALINDNRFSSNYRLVGVTRYDWFRDRCYWTYVRKDVPLSPAQVKSLPKGIGMPE
jgi:arabinofuranosyltransferase